MTCIFRFQNMYEAPVIKIEWSVDMKIKKSINKIKSKKVCHNTCAINLFSLKVPMQLHWGKVGLSRIIARIIGYFYFLEVPVFCSLLCIISVHFLDLCLRI